MTTVIQHHGAQPIGTYLEEETIIMYKNLLKKPWTSQAVFNTKKDLMGDRLIRWIKQGRMPVSMMFKWDATPQGWDYWNNINNGN